MKTKVCTKCGEEKLLDGYENSKGGKFGKRADCRDCRNAARVARRLANPESREKDMAAGRKAYAKLAKDPEWVAKRNLRGRELYADDPTRYAEVRKEWNKRNPDKIREYARRHAKTDRKKETARKYREANREHLNACSRVRHANNPKKQREATAAWYRKNKERVSEYNRDYKKKHRKLIAFLQRQYVSRKNGAVGTATEEQIKSRLDYHGNRCIYCGRDGPMEIEHMIPLSRGGTNWPANLAPACRSCNSSKRSKTFFEFKGAKA